VRARAKVEALCRVEAVAVHENDAKPGQRLAAPASRRAGRVGTAFDVHIETQALALAGKHRLDHDLGPLPFRDLRLPRDAEQSVAGVARLTQLRSHPPQNLHVVARNDNRPVDEI
jgi:hypothetical protein